jgi:hypothetical protein
LINPSSDKSDSIGNSPSHFNLNGVVATKERLGYRLSGNQLQRILSGNSHTLNSLNLEYVEYVLETHTTAGTIIVKSVDSKQLS